MPVAAHQETENSEKYARGGLEGRLVARFSARVCATVTAERPGSVLDAGCGEGTMTARLAAALPGARVVGVEARPEALADLRRAHPELEARAGDVYGLPFEDDAFDVAVCLEVLEHLEQPEAAVRELARVARRAILVTVPWEPFFAAGNLVRGRYPRRLGSTPGHRHHWGPRGLRRTVGRAAVPERWLPLFPWHGVLARPR